MPDRHVRLFRRRERRRSALSRAERISHRVSPGRRAVPVMSVLTALATGAVALALGLAATAAPNAVAADAVTGSVPTVTVHSITTPMTNLTPHTGVTRTAGCPAGTLVGGGGYLRNATDPSVLPTNGLVLGGTNPSTGSSPVDQPAADGATNPGNWTAIANFTGVAEAGDQATAYALCASDGPTQTVVASNSTVGANATQQVAPPNLTVATCPAGTTLIGGGAFTGTPDQVNDGTTVGNNGNLKPLGSYPSDASGVPAADGSTSATSWSAYGSAGITSANDKVTSIALCTPSPSPVQVARVDVSGPDAQPGTTVTTATAVCPAGTQMLGGGYRTDQTVNGTSGLQPQQGYHMRGSYPSSGPGALPADVADGTTNPSAWSALVQAGGQNLPTGSSMQLHGFALCAQPSATPTPTSTSTQLGVTPSGPAAAGTEETLTATVTPAAAGTVQFRDGTAPLGDPVPVTGAAASLTTTLPPGTHTLSATFTPADPAAFTGSTSATVSYVVNGTATATTTALVADPNPAAAGKPVKLTAQVSPRGAHGTIQFLDGTAPLGDPQPVKPNGTAQLNTKTLTPGSHTLTARFIPTDPAAFDPSTSPPVTLTVNPPRR